MKRFVSMFCVAFFLGILYIPDVAGAPQTKNKESKRAERAAAKQELRTKSEYRKMNKENHKLRKKMFRESKRANRRGVYDVNSLGNVF